MSAIMATKYREEIVGKRFLSVVSGFSKLKLNKIAEWGWRTGVIRAASHKDNTDKDLQVLVEYDDMEWHRREWISIYKDSLFNLFLVEQGLVWSDRKDPFAPTNHSPNVFWPALSFVALVSIVELSPQYQPVEFLLDQELAFRDFTRIHPFQDWDSSLPGVKRDYPELRQAVRRWAELQDGQRILLATPSVLVGYRVEVYRAEGTTQWYTAVIIGYNEATRELTVTDDTVLEEHNEDPSLLQMRLIGDGVVESIMRGENVGITPRRSRSSTVLNHLHHSLSTSRVSRGLAGGSVSGGIVSGVSGGGAAPQNSHVSALTGSRKHRKQQSVAAASAADAAATPNSAEQLQIRVAQQHGDILRQDASGKGTVPNVRNTRKCNRSNENEQHNTYRSRTRSNHNTNHSNGQHKERGAAQQRRQQLLQATVISTAGKQQANRKRNNRNISRKKVLEESNNSKLRNVEIRIEDCLQAKKKPVSNNEESIEQTTEQSIVKEDNNEQEVKEENTVNDIEEDRQEEEEQPIAADSVVEEQTVIATAAVCPSETIESEQPAGEDVEREQEQTSNRGDDDDADGVLVNSGEGVISTSALDETSSGSSVQLVSDEIIVSKQESCNDDDDDVDASASVKEVSVAGSSLLSDETVVVDNGCSSVSRQEEAAVVEEDVDEEVDEDEEEEDDCVIVSEKRIEPRREVEEIEGDRKHSEQEVGQSAALRGSADRVEYDDGPLVSASPLNNRMDLDNNSQSTALLRFADDRSDSGVSSLRSGSCASGDERSGSRSSALSSSDEPPPPSHQSNTRSPLFASEQNTSKPQSAEPVRVWRDPNLLLESEPHVRHIHSVQHQTLLMSHPPPTAPRGEANAPPGSSASHPPAGLYPPPPLLNPYPLHPHPSVLPHHLPLPAADLIWKRYPPPPVGAAHLLGPQPTHQAAEELIERERAYAHDRDRQERLLRERREQEVRDLKERERERERIEREREREKMEREREQREREKADRDRQERLERDKQERERLEMQRAAEQAVHKHFEQSLSRLEKRGDRNNISGWNLISSLPPPPRGGVVSVEEERKRMEQEHQREQHRQMAAVEKMRHDVRDRTYYSQQTQRPPSVPGKADYPPPAHSRSSGINKSLDKVPSSHAALPKAEPNFSIFGGYPSYTPGFMTHDPKQRTDHHKVNSGLVTGKTIDNRERDIVGPPPLMSELKNTVIVKHEGKSPHGLEPKVSAAHSPSPKLRVSDMMPHYLSASSNQQHKSAGVYEYRSPSQSPHHGMQHHHVEQKVMSHHHRSSNQLPSPHQVHQRQSPHRPPHPSPPEGRYQRVVDSAYASAKPPVSVSSYAYPPQQMTSVHYTLPAGAAISASVKPKVSSPALPHVYGKPSPAGIVSGIPVCRTQESMHSSNQMPMNSKLPSVSPSPYQQVSQYPPPQHPQHIMAAGPPPPPAHSSRSTAAVPDQRNLYDRIYSSGSVPVKSIPPHHGASPPTGAAAPPNISRSPHQLHNIGLLPPSHHSSVGMSPAVQTQPLDLGVSSDRNSDRGSPKRKGNIMHHPIGSPIALDVKKRRVDSPGSVPPPVQPLQNHPLSLHASTGHPQLARVSEASPLIASAATAITTVVNTAACCTSAASITVAHSQSNEVPIGSPVISITSIPVRNDDCMRPSSAGSSSSIRIPTPASNPPMTGGSSSPAPAPSPVPITITTATTACTTTSNSRVPPSTPVKVTLAPSVTDSEKSNSPGPVKSSASSGSYPVRHLKKAWLQRHTGEDVEDNTGVVGSGSCVTLPISINSTVQSNKDSLGSSVTASLHNIGSMAVNSINKKSLSSKGSRKPASSKDTSLNGHSNDSTKADDSSSSDQERGRKSPPKRKPPKVKRKKGGGSIRKTTSEELKKKKPTKESDSGSDSDKESVTDKDSDSGASSNQLSAKKGNSSNQSSGQPSNGNKEPRKRGRRPKSSKNDKSEEPRNKKPRGDEQQSTQNPPRDPFRKPPVGQLKKTGESFLQDGPCFEVAPKLAKCRECRWTPNQRSKNMPNIFCRFYAFRRLRYTKNGQLAIAGFSDPHKDATEEDLKLWIPLSDAPPSDLDQDMSRFLLRQVGDQFCDLLVQEKEAHKEHMAEDKTVAWKRVVQGVREMCDVCETTLFNFHWACGKCGFVVCIDCYKSRKNGTVKIWGESGKDRDDFSWLLCTNRQAHEQEKLMLTQIIAGDSLLKLGRKVHETRELFDIPQYCGCPISKEVQKLNGAMKDALKTIKTEPNGIKQEKQEPGDTKNLLNGGSIKEENTLNSPLNWLADVALSNEDKKSNSEGSFSGDSDGEDGNFSTLRELLIRPSHKTNGSRASSPAANISSASNKNTKKSRMDTLDEVISSVIEDSVPKIDDEAGHDIKNMELKHFVRRYNWTSKGRDPLPIRIMTLTESKILYPDTPHSWLCDGKLLRLTDPNHKNNYRIFQDQWKRGQPVIVSDVTRHLDMTLWHPDSFARDFGDDKNDLINCMTGNLVPNQPMRKFWEGFEHFSKRLKDERGNPMLLKLKDWPPGEDFSEILPSRFSDLIKVLPLSEYTRRDGRLNLASRLPECFVRPDLGPKMYNAYGSALHPTKGTTNLHLDISDAVNVMVYVGIPKDGDNEEHIKEAFRAIDEAGCDILTRRRVRDKGELPGALWHIYHARDADKIRDLLNKVALERGARLEPHHDPIHDQSCYLDGPLRERLYKEYGVEGYAIVQCLGDAVFIPAGAPHQVRNLHNCIKVAEDFVSPENVSHCFHLTQEFRALSDTHTNHEDKLQIKNIIYHAVKDSLSVLSSTLEPRIKKEEPDGSAEQTVASSGSSSDTNSSTGSPVSHDADSKDTV